MHLKDADRTLGVAGRVLGQSRTVHEEQHSALERLQPRGRSTGRPGGGELRCECPDAPSSEMALSTHLWGRGGGAVVSTCMPTRRSEPRDGAEHSPVGKG